MAKRDYGTGQLYVDFGSYYGRWRTLDGRKLNRKVGKVRPKGSSDGLTRPEAERRFRKMQEEEGKTRRPAASERRTVDDATVSLRRKLAIEGCRTSYLQGTESMQRVHISPRIGSVPVDRVTQTQTQIEDVAAEMLAAGLAPKTVRNVITFLHSVFEHAIDKKWAAENPVRRATRPKRRRAGDANPDLQFLTVAELKRVLSIIPDQVVHREPAPTRRGRRGPAPPPPPDVLGPVIRMIILVAALTGLRQSELLGLRWRDVDWTAQRIRVRNTFVRGEHSGEGKSDLSTRRSVPMADLVVHALRAWLKRTNYSSPDDLVFAHPQTGRPVDRSKLSRRFKNACRDAGVRVIPFKNLRHTFATRLAASGQPLRSIQEFLGHADSKTTQIYAHYARQSAKSRWSTRRSLMTRKATVRRTMTHRQQHHAAVASPISKAENGMQVMAPDKAATIAAALNYAPSILSCDGTVQGIDALFHRKLKTVPVSKLRQTQAEINVRRMQVRRLLKGVAIDAPNSFPRLDPEDVGGPEEVARLVRRAWRLPLGPIPDLARMLEAAGGVVVPMTFATDKVSAAAMWPRTDERPMFFVNKNHNAERQRFSLAHELAHVVMHDVPAPELEEQADRFAAEFLMPEAEVKPQLTAHRLNLARLIDIKHHWKVSISFVAKRAKDLGAVTERQARSLFQMLNARGYLKKEPFPIPAETPQTLDNALRLHVVDHSYSLNELGALAFLDGRGFAEAFEDFMSKLGGDVGRADRSHLRAVPST